MPTLVEMKQIVKHFPGLIANDHVNFEAQTGEIHGLLGENGAGKTTLMNILYGLYQQDQGDIFFAGSLVHIDSPKKALELGIGMVHQHFRLIPRLTVLENIVLGLKADIPPHLQRTDVLTTIRRKYIEIFGLNMKEAETRVTELSEKFGLKIHPRAKIWELSVGEQQRVEIIKALYRNAKLLILDEPTAVLTPQEVDSLFEMLNTMVKQGYTIVFITHKLNEVMELCHRITVLRHGKVIATVNTTETEKKDLAKMMVGREVLFQVEKPEVAPGKEVLRVEDLCVLNDKGLEAVRGASFAIHEGEILGIAGVSGNGQKELVEALNGLRPVERGHVYFRQMDLTNAPSKKIVDQGVGYIPEDRMSVGLATSLPITENLLLKSQREPQFNHGWFLNESAVKATAKRLIQDFDVRTPSITIPVGRLSGGNIQKIILAREISRNPKLLIASQPTRGLDVGAIEYVQTTLLDQKRQGKAILLISENLDETLHLSDRIAVIYEGQIVGILSAEETDRREIGMMMAGGHRQAP
ncbi:ribose ABC transporter, ATP-binding protein, RbsA-1 [Candidatus Vecturithrix granuli]|uniref:Ribose ABC transporter, ATP-binding protein, RbsA-1 n=1 Tax=Vecturithrix granuli TaxID=1499967 RepID=A0A081C4I5_VECG1|nr:ribose ABC transporter, ATP-binding protein, RbsA-1 [Candidatus Vecturithrix granuli]